MGRIPVDQCIEILGERIGRIPVDQCIEILVRKDRTDTCRPVY